MPASITHDPKTGRLAFTGDDNNNAASVHPYDNNGIVFAIASMVSKDQATKKVLDVKSITLPVAAIISPITFHGFKGDDIFANYIPTKNCLVYGGEGNDILVGNNGSDTLWGGEGSDRLEGWGGPDCLMGGAGIDFLYGMKAADFMHTGVDDVADFTDKEASDTVKG